MCSKMLLELSDQDIQIKTVIYSINNCNFTSHYNFNNRYFTESNPAVAELPVCYETSLPKKKFNQIRHDSKCHPETTRFDHETMVRLVKIARPSRCNFEYCNNSAWHSCYFEPAQNKSTKFYKCSSELASSNLTRRYGCTTLQVIFRKTFEAILLLHEP
jgi:hypothetical protein